MSAGSTIWKCSIRQRRSPAIFCRQLLVDTDDLRIGGVADRMGRDLEAGRGGRIGERQHLGIRVELQPARIGLVGIGLLQPCAARSERAVGE